MRVSVKISAKRDLRQSCLVVGRSGSGKSVFLLLLAYELIRKSQSARQHGVIVIDPHGDLAKAVLRFAIHADPSRLIYISSSINNEAKTPAGKEVTAVFNPFQSDGTPEMDYLLTETLTDSLCELLAEATLTTQMIAIIRPCLATVIRLKNGQANLATLHRFFMEGHNEDLLEAGRNSEIYQHRLFFMHEWYNDAYKLSKTSIKTKLSFFLSDPRLAALINGQSTFDLKAALNNGSVVVFGLPRGSSRFVSKVMSSLVTAYINASLMTRDSVPMEQRKTVYLIADEFQTMVSSRDSLVSSLAELRKYGLSCILATQSLMQIDDATLRKTVLVNTGLKAVSLTDAQDRSSFAKELGITATEIEGLRPLQFYLKRNDGRHKAFKFTVPILGRAFMLSKAETKKLLDYIVYESGHYIPIPPPPSPPSVSMIPAKRKTTNNSPMLSTQSNDGLKPAF